jgi:hypothetical protein
MLAQHFADESSVEATASKATTCHIEVGLQNGKILSGSIEFGPLGGCCTGWFIGVDASPFVYVDGGIDGG